jgi:hypothetical protein
LSLDPKVVDTFRFAKTAARIRCVNTIAQGDESYRKWPSMFKIPDTSIEVCS